LALLLLFTNPNNVALPVLMAPFILIGLLVYQITELILTRKGSAVRSYAVRLFAMSIAFLIVALLLLRSLHQLTLKDSLLVCGFTLAFWLYVWRADFLHK
ncbi:MAG TPA: hypothetical protein VM124_01845, partial [Candidatus Limnocylindrales bacterium]|nr:hypothetical protein [Candidatus Limnocylindrales bacterium]